jgi:ketol-acid reductoisomerase
MLITKEQQEALLDKYIRENHNTDECIGFIDGMNALFELISNIEKRNNVVVEKSLDWALYI